MPNRPKRPRVEVAHADAPDASPPKSQKNPCPLSSVTPGGCDASVGHYRQSCSHLNLSHTVDQRKSLPSQFFDNSCFRRCAVCSIIYWSDASGPQTATSRCKHHRPAKGQCTSSANPANDLREGDETEGSPITHSGIPMWGEQDFTTWALWRVVLPASLPADARPVLATVINWLLHQKHSTVLMGLFLFPKAVLRSIAPAPAPFDLPVHVLKQRCRSLMQNFVDTIGGLLEEAKRDVSKASDPIPDDDDLSALLDDVDEEDDDTTFLNSISISVSDCQPLSKTEIERIMRLCEHGCFSRAAAAFCASPLANFSADVAAKLQDLHPPASSPPVPPRSPLQGYSTPTHASVEKCLSSFKKGSGAGPSGLRADWLKELTMSPGCRVTDLVALAMWLLITGRCPEELRKIYAGARLVALPKPPPTGPDIRPVAVGELLRRIAGKHVAHSTIPLIIKRLLAARQVSVGVSDGVGAAIHTLQWVLENHPSACVLGTDLKNAFNNIFRSCFLRECEKVACPEFVSFVYFLYGDVSFLFFGSFVLRSANGAQQGCPLAGILFCLVLALFFETVLKNAVARLLACSFVADDAAFVGDLSTLAEIAHQFTVHGPEFGIFLRADKCRLFLPPKLETCPMLSPLVECVRRPSAAVTLAKCVAGDLREVAKHASAVARRIAEWTLRLSAFAAEQTQAALWLARSCSGFASANYFLRALRVDPGCWAAIDVALSDVLAVIVPASPASCYVQASLPVRFGGLGLRTCVDHQPAALSAAIYAASLVMPHLVNASAGPLPIVASCPSQKKQSEAIDLAKLRELFAAGSPEIVLASPRLLLPSLGLGSPLVLTLQSSSCSALPSSVCL